MKAEEGVVSVIDIGSNTIKHLVAASGMRILEHGSEDVRIGTGMGKEGPVRLLPEAMRAAADCVSDLWESAEAFSPTKRAIVATSAVRDAVNRDEFIAMVKADTGAEIRVLSGEEEAQYVGAGVARDPNISAYKPFYLMDLGGGSLELLEYSGGIVRQKVSLPLGAVRLKEKLVRDASAALSPGEMAEIGDYIALTVAASGFSFHNPGALIGTGGGLTHARFMIAAQEGVKKSDSSPTVKIHDMRRLMRKLAALTLAERLAIKNLPPTRADIMPVALVVITTVMELAMASSIVHSFYNLRYGLAAELLGEK